MGSERPFFSARGDGRDPGPAGSEGVGWAEVFATLAGAGFGAPDRLGYRYTGRQLTLYYRQVQRLRSHRQADLIEGVLFGQPQDSKTLKSTQQHIKTLRKA